MSLPRPGGGAVVFALQLLVVTTAWSQTPKRSFVEVPCTQLWGSFEHLPSNALHCGTVTVPQNRRAPNDTRLVKVVLPVVHIAAPNATATPMVFLPGGPGESAIFALQRAFLRTPSGELAVRRRPVIAFDRRGFATETGRANPDLGAVNTERRATREASIVALRDSMKANTKWLASQGVEPRYFSTLDAVDDIADVIRALGYTKVVLFTASYGTREALYFMRRYPYLVESAVLDGVAPPQTTNLFEPEFIAKARGSVVGRIAADCIADLACAAEYPELGKTMARLADSSTAMLRLTANFPENLGWRTVRLPRQAILSTLGLMATAENVRAIVPQLLEDFASGDTLRRPLAADIVLAASADSIGRAGIGPAAPLVYDIAVCADFPNGSPQRGGRATCDALQVPFGGLDVIAPVTTNIPVLLIASGYDARTPASLADEAARTLPRGRLVLFPLIGHVAFVHTTVMACVAVVVESFLAHPETEPANLCVGSVAPAFMPRSVDAPNRR